MFTTKILTNRILQRQCFAFTNRFLSAAVGSEKAAPTQKFFRTSECDPTKHGELDDGLFYTIPQEIASRLFVLGGLEKEQQLMMKTFQETSFMVRQPALKILEKLKNTDFSEAPKRYVLYGRIGSGKSFTMNHILHYGYSNQFVILHCPKPTDWTRYPQEYSTSTNNQKRIDTPLDAAIWLQHFRAQNYNLLQGSDLKSLNKYTWSAREITNPGDSILSIVEHGINRIKHATDCAAVVLKELKENSATGNCRLMVAIEKVNSFYERSHLTFPDKTFAKIEDITLARAFKKLITHKDWKNGVMIVSVDKKLVVPYRILPIHGTKKVDPSDRTYRHWGPFDVSHLSDLPEDLLTDEGVKDFEPFERIPVDKYTDKELISCLDYYEDRHWIQRPEAKSSDGREEIRFLSGNNPGHVYELCSAL